MARKYRRGEQIKTLQEFSEQEFIWWMGKVYHRGFAWSWQFFWIMQRLNGKQLFKVEQIKEEEECK